MTLNRLIKGRPVYSSDTLLIQVLWLHRDPLHLFPSSGSSYYLIWTLCWKGNQTRSGCICRVDKLRFLSNFVLQMQRHCVKDSRNTKRLKWPIVSIKGDLGGVKFGLSESINWLVSVTLFAPQRMTHKPSFVKQRCQKCDSYVWILSFCSTLGKMIHVCTRYNSD